MKMDVPLLVMWQRNPVPEGFAIQSRHTMLRKYCHGIVHISWAWYTKWPLRQGAPCEFCRAILYVAGIVFSGNSLEKLSRSSVALIAAQCVVAQQHQAQRGRKQLQRFDAPQRDALECMCCCGCYMYYRGVCKLVAKIGMCCMFSMACCSSMDGMGKRPSNVAPSCLLLTRADVTGARCRRLHPAGVFRLPGPMLPDQLLPQVIAPHPASIPPQGSGKVRGSLSHRHPQPDQLNGGSAPQSSPY